MSSIFDVRVSCQKTATDLTVSSCNLYSFLFSKKMQDLYRSTVESIREQQGDIAALKRGLPCITPSALVDTHRLTSCAVAHSGFVSFDIDAKENPLTLDMPRVLRSRVSIMSPYIAYTSLSASGRSVWGLVKTEESIEGHKTLFLAIKMMFHEQGIYLDSAPSNIVSLRFYSYDDRALINEDAETLTVQEAQEYIDATVVKQEVKFAERKNSTKSEYKSSMSAYDRVAQKMEKIRSSGVDITSGYSDYLLIGFAFAREFGESGRNFFFDISMNANRYEGKPGLINSQYSRCISNQNSGGPNRSTLGTFFYLCEIWGI